MPQPKPSTAEMSMPTFETLEEWTRGQIQSLMQSVLDEEVTQVLGAYFGAKSPGPPAEPEA